MASRLYESAPWGLIDQRAFLNQALSVSTSLDPHQLLNEISQIEDIAGRQRDQHWGPRTLDIDILLYDDLTLETENLQIPHPRLAERNFALLPLGEIAPDLVHPVLELPVSQLVMLSPDRSEVSILSSS
jgi:2-amino-4-hydroxy-6-hydroxymethyldihydropteridine diphosphokinase